MKSSLEIEACSAADVNKISEVAIRAYRDFYLYLWEDDGSWYINRSFAPEQIEKEINDTNAVYFSLKAEGEIVGFMKLNINQPLKGHEEFDAMELERIYLLKSASGKGIGRQAVKFCIDFAKKKNKQIIWLRSMDSSEAIYFYERLGFVECGNSRLDFELMKPAYRGMKTFMKKIT
jgi:GNAT superfamily N-acetyltransferase